MGRISGPCRQLHRAWVFTSTAWALREGMTDPLDHSIPLHFRAKVGEGCPQGNQQWGRTQFANCGSLAWLQGRSCGTYMLWRTHQPQWGSREPRHSSQLSYCSQLSTGTRVTCGEQAGSAGGRTACFPAVPTPRPRRDRPSTDSPWPLREEAAAGSRLSPWPSPALLPGPGSTFAGHTSTPGRFLPQPSSFHRCTFAGLWEQAVPAQHHTSSQHRPGTPRMPQPCSRRVTGPLLIAPPDLIKIPSFVEPFELCYNCSFNYFPPAL